MTRKAKFFGIGGAIFVVALIFTGYICSARMESAEMRLQEGLRGRQAAEIGRMAKAVNVWRGDLSREIHMVSASDTFRILLSDLSALSEAQAESYLRKETGGDEAVASLVEQADLAASLLSDLAEKSMFGRARILSLDGRELLSGGVLPVLPEEGRGLASRAIETGKMAFGPIYEEKGSFRIDVADPVFEISGKANPKPIGAFHATVPLDRLLREILAPRDGVDPAVADRESGFVVTLDGKEPAFAKTLVIFGEEGFEFGRRTDIANDRPCYSMAANMDAPNWTLAAETPASALDATLAEARAESWVFALLVSAGLALLGASAWLFLSRGEYIRRSEELERKNRLIGEQKDMLDGLNQSLSAGMALLGQNGELRASNAAMLSMLGIDRAADGALLRNLMPLSAWNELSSAIPGAKDKPEIEIAMNGRLYRVGIFPGRRGDTAIVFQDITEHRERARRKAMRQKALVKAMQGAIEGVDPDLAGHSGKLARLSARMGAMENLPQDSLEAMELAAELSQIGKIFVPQSILLKDGKLTDEEKAEVAAGLKRGADLLSGMDFGLPVPEIAAELNSGRPVSREARILCLANAFIAMTSRRKWRASAMSFEDALAELSGDARFAEEDIEALRKASKAGWQ